MASLGAERLPSSLLGSAATQMSLEELVPSFKEMRLGGTKTVLAGIIDEAFFERGTLPKASSALNGLNNSLERLASSARAAVPPGILQSTAGNPRFRRPEVVSPSQPQGIFTPSLRPTPEPPFERMLSGSPGVSTQPRLALPAAGETSARAMREAAVALRELVARQRSNERSASVTGEGMWSKVAGQVPVGSGGPFLPSGLRGGALSRARFLPSDGPVPMGPSTPIGPGSQHEKFKTALDVASASTRNFTASQIPLVGGLRSLAGEFGEATKQVLLYGTAYKGLAFVLSLPGQILNAAKSQQQFNNGLKVATQETGTFAKELLYVDNVQRAFGLNLETTRTGFTKLYASMAPTGFDSGSIEKLFTGISAATAALQLTPDQTERVIYAFSQMSSKGQIMSEELKGQLGDVLPGALALFSKAAGMSVQEFNKAMEDGLFVGTRFREVFGQVSDELMNRFGTGAQIAGRSLQGLINTVGGDFQRTLESFAPLANAAAQATLGPLTGMLREVSMAAQLAMGEQDRVAKQLKAAQDDVSALKLGGADAKDIKAAEVNVGALAAKYEALNEAAKDPAIAQQVKNIESFVAEIQKAATFTLNFAGAIGTVLSPLFTVLGGNLTSVVGNLALLALGFNAAKLAALLFMGVANAMRAIEGITRGAAVSTTLLSAAYRALGVQVTTAQIATIGFGAAMKGLLIGTGVGAVIVLLGSLAAAFLSVADKAKEAADRAKQSINSMADAARTGNVSLIEMELSVNKADRQDIENLIKQIEGLSGPRRNVQGGGSIERITLTPAQKREAKRLGAQVDDIVIKQSLLQSLKNLRAPLQEAATEGQQDLVTARKRAEQLGLNKPDPAATGLPGEEEGKKDKEKKENLSQYASLQDQLAKDFTQYQIDLLDIEHQHKVSLMNVFYDLQESRANSQQKAAIRFQKELYNIASDYQGAQLKAQAEIMKAQGSVAGGAPSLSFLPPAQGGGGAFDTGMRTGPSSAIGGSADYHQDIMFGSSVSMKERVQLMDQLARGYEAMGRTIEFSNNAVANERYRSSMSYEAKTSLISRAQAAHANRRGGSGRPAMDYYAPLASENRRGQSVVGQAMLAPAVPGASYSYGGGGRSGRTMTASRDGQMVYQQLHGSMAVPLQAGAPRQITSDEARDTRAAQQTQLAIQKEKASVTLKEVEAIRKMEVAMENYVASIVPVAEQDLQNRLLAQRVQLATAIASPAILDAQIKYAEQEAIATENIRLNNAEISKLSKSKDANGQISVETAARIDTLRQANEKLKTSLPTSQIQILTEAIDKQVLSVIQQNQARQIEAENSRQVNRLIIEGMTRQEAEASVAADRLRADYVQALELTNNTMKKASTELEILNLRKAQGIALTEGETAQYEKLTRALADATAKRSEQEGLAPRVESAAAALAQGATATPGDTLQAGFVGASERLAELKDIEKQGVAIANTIGDAFGQSFRGILSGTSTAQEALANFFQSVADYFADMVASMIAEYLKMTLLKGIMGLLPGAGSIAGGLSGAFGASGPSFSPETFLGPALAGGAGLGGSGVQDFSSAFGAGGSSVGTAFSGVKLFANGGIVTGPTLGIVGEGKYNEAIIPLPDGKSVPVELGGTAGGIQSSIVINIDGNGNVNSDSSGSNASDFGRKIEGAVKQAIVNELRPGGVLARGSR
jgi:tape measure domain-containing protein